MERVPARHRGREGGRKRGSLESGGSEKKSDSAERCLSAAAFRCFLALCFQMGTISQMRDRPRPRPPLAFGNDEREEDGRLTRGSSLNQHAEFLEGIPLPLPSFARSLARSFVRSMPLTKVLLGSVFHFGFLPRGENERRGRGLEMLYLNEPTPSLSSPSLSLFSSSPSRFRRRRFPQTVQQK